MIELMVALAIISILAAIILPHFVRSRYRAYVAACTLNERNLATALESYRADNRSSPATLDVLVQANLGGQINKLPTCPSAPGVPYHYDTTAEMDNYTVYCQGYHSKQLPEHTVAGYPQYSAGSGLLAHP